MTTENAPYHEGRSTAPSLQLLKSVLDYDPETGDFKWKISPRNGIPAGRCAGFLHVQGCYKIQWCGVEYPAHKLAWYYMTGEWRMVDHRNRKRWDNTFSNLRPATHQQNMANQVARNKLGVKGVYPYSKNRFIAQIRYSGRGYHLGIFNTIEEAKAAYNSAAAKFFGEYACD